VRILIELYCLKCSCIKDHCRCGNKNFIEIDDNFVDIITTLNKKGYETQFSCGGHVGISRNCMYIVVKNYDKALGIPTGMEYFKDKTTGHTLGFYSEKSDFTNYTSELYRQESVIREWANGLPVWSEWLCREKG
jgi:hypothetical protein